MLVSALERARQIYFMVALGTHPSMTTEELEQLVGITAEERATVYSKITIQNHAWNDPSALIRIGTIPVEQLRSIAGPFWHPSLGGDVPIRLNRAAIEADRILIVGPVFPHEVAGFSGGAKYLFPGISGPEMIDVSHWLGALAGISRTIGIAETPVREMIETAADVVPTPITLLAFVVDKTGILGVFAGDRRTAWSQAVELSRRTHIIWQDEPFNRVISWAPPMYDELWTAGKAMYKLECATADGGELIIYAPHLRTVSQVHGDLIYQVGYHVLPYFLEQWDRFSEIPLAVLAHSTHVKGAGTFEHGVERPRIDVKLSSQIPEADCMRLNLGYVDPASIDPAHPPEGYTLIPNAGEVLYRIRS